MRLQKGLPAQIFKTPPIWPSFSPSACTPLCVWLCHATRLSTYLIPEACPRQVPTGAKQTDSIFCSARIHCSLNKWATLPCIGLCARDGQVHTSSHMEGCMNRRLVLHSYVVKVSRVECGPAARHLPTMWVVAITAGLHAGKTPAAPHPQPPRSLPRQPHQWSHNLWPHSLELSRMAQPASACELRCPAFSSQTHSLTP